MLGRLAQKCDIFTLNMYVSIFAGEFEQLKIVYLLYLYFYNNKKDKQIF